jgi:predicted histone-like DNA-binding protein
MINYRLVERSKPGDSTAVPKFYALAVSSGTSNLREVAEKISARSTVTTIDAYAVLEAFVNLVPEELAEGRIVKLGDFGSFRVGIKSEGVENADDFSQNLITKTKVYFRRGPEFSNKISNLDYKKLNTSNAKVTAFFFICQFYFILN